MEKRLKGKPFFDKKKEIKSEFDDYLENVEMHVNGSADNVKGSIDDFLYGSNNNINTKNNEEALISEEYRETIKPLGLLPVNYFVSQNAFNEINSIKEKYELVDKDGSLDEQIFRFAIGDGRMDILRGDLKEVYVPDPESVFPTIKILKEDKYIVTSNEASGGIESIQSFKEVTMSSALPNDIVNMSDIDDASTQKKINNLMNGSGSLKPFEPFDHEWENEQYKK